MNHCIDCKHWSEDLYSSPTLDDSDRFGGCVEIREKVDVLGDMVECVEPYGNFGCVLWAAKED